MRCPRCRGKTFFDGADQQWFCLCGWREPFETLSAEQLQVLRETSGTHYSGARLQGEPTQSDQSRRERQNRQARDYKRKKKEQP